MINILKKTLEINYHYNSNIIIYNLKKVPVFKDLFTNEIYSSVIIKKIIYFFYIIFSFCKTLLSKSLYFLLIYFVSYIFFFDNLSKSLLHLFLIFVLINLFNHKILSNNMLKYYNLKIFKLDATKYFKVYILCNIIKELLYNYIFLLLFIPHLENDSNIFVLLIFLISAKIIGEALNILNFKKRQKFLIDNNILKILITIIIILLFSFQFFEIFVSYKFILILTVIFTYLQIFSIYYLFTLKDYKYLYKIIDKNTNLNDPNNEKSYLRQALINKKNQTNNNLINKKKGFDLFNEIFFYRHKEILINSAKNYSIFLIIIYFIIGFLTLYNNKFAEFTRIFLTKKMSWFILIMFFLNRGEVITKAMFYNCDHAMLKYSFYRKPKNILNLFKKRLITIIYINLITSSVIVIGNLGILLLLKNYNLSLMLSNIIFIISLNILFSIHYLVIYYLFQPFNKNMEIKKKKYSVIITFTYLLSFILKDIEFNSINLSLLTLIFTIFYLVISFFLIFLNAPKSFKLKE